MNTIEALNIIEDYIHGYWRKLVVEYGSIVFAKVYDDNTLLYESHGDRLSPALIDLARQIRGY